MALLDTAPLPTPTVWESLATRARWLADHAQRLADMDPVDLVPIPPSDDFDDGGRDHLAELEESATLIYSLAFACRRQA
jgi:hypothetical protein